MIYVCFLVIFVININKYHHHHHNYHLNHHHLCVSCSVSYSTLHPTRRPSGIHPSYTLIYILIYTLWHRSQTASFMSYTLYIVFDVQKKRTKLPKLEGGEGECPKANIFFGEIVPKTDRGDMLWIIKCSFQILQQNVIHRECDRTSPSRLKHG